MSDSKNTATTISITSETKKRISLSNYTNLPGTRKENILCALLTTLSVVDKPMSAKDFFTIYIWFVPTVYQGRLVIDFSMYPHLKDHPFLKEIESLAGDDTESLIGRKPCLQIAKAISNDDKAFIEDLEECYTDWEVRLLIFSFSPSCMV